MVPDFKRGDAFKTFLAEKRNLRKIVKEMKLIP